MVVLCRSIFFFYFMVFEQRRLKRDTKYFHVRVKLVSRTKKEKHRLSVFESRLLLRIRGPGRKKSNMILKSAS